MNNCNELAELCNNCNKALLSDEQCDSCNELLCTDLSCGLDNYCKKCAIKKGLS